LEHWPKESRRELIRINRARSTCHFRINLYDRSYLIDVQHAAIVSRPALNFGTIRTVMSGSRFGRASGQPHGSGARQVNAAHLAEGCERGTDLPRFYHVGPRFPQASRTPTAGARGLSFHFSET
jgi:hypothetical protein